MRRLGRLGRNDERGMATTALVVCVLVAIIALVFIAVVPLLRGTEQGGRGQTAADAAVLAGADSVRDSAVAQTAGLLVAFGPSRLRGTSVSWALPGVGAGGMGITEATVFARRNDATLVTYRNDAARDRVRVEVRLDRQAGGADDVVIRRVAEARVGVELSSCRARADRPVLGYTTPPPTPSPTPAPTPAPTPTPTPSPTPTFVPAPIYGAWGFSFSCDGADGFDVSATSVAQLVDLASAEFDALEPRLVS